MSDKTLDALSDLLFGGEAISREECVSEVRRLMRDLAGRERYLEQRRSALAHLLDLEPDENWPAIYRAVRDLKRVL